MRNAMPRMIGFARGSLTESRHGIGGSRVIRHGGLLGLPVSVLGGLRKNLQNDLYNPKCGWQLSASSGARPLLADKYMPIVQVIDSQGLTKILSCENMRME